MPPAAAPTATPFELQILGPLHLRGPDGVLPLSSRKAQALLLLLVLEGETSRPRLCARLWPAQDESSARRNLRRDLARLREAGVGDAVLAEGDRLRPAPMLGCDLLRAEATLANGQAEAVLSLWRGPPLEGLRDTGDNDTDVAREGSLAAWLEGVGQRAAGLLQRALQASAEAAEARGELHAALAHVHRLLELDNLQERQHREAMRLLAACGQREEALRQFERCRGLLAQELGVEPMPETLALAQTLRQPGTPPAAAGLEAPRVATVASPTPGAPSAVVKLPPQLPFVGREAEVAALQRAWERQQPLLVVGEPGVGKTRLLADFAAAQGTFALARCQPADREWPLSAFARALRALAGQPPDVTALPGWVVAELARLLPELGLTPPPLANANERLRFEQACAQAWHGLAEGNFDAVLLDDWQWADDASRALLARVVAPAAARLLLTWRGEPDEPALLATAEALAAEPLPMAALPEPAVQELVRQLSGSPAPQRFARRLLAATGGLPFFIVETLRDLAERAVLRRDTEDRWHTAFDEHTADYEELPLAPSVRAAVLARVRRLPAPATRLLEAAALAGEPLAAAWLAQACALSELEAVQGLEQAAEAHLVQALQGGGYGWTHDLARQALESTLQPTRRRLLHHRLALGAQATGRQAEAARHFEACGEPARAVPHRLAAGDAAHALHALAQAATQWRQGLADGPAPADEAALLARLCEVQWQLGHHDESRALHARLQGRLAEPGLDPAVASDLQIRAAKHLSTRGDTAQALALLDAMARPEAAAVLLRWWVCRMGALHHAGRLDEATADGKQALKVAPAGSREQAEVLASLSTLARSRGRMQEAIAHADASLALFTRLGDANGRVRGLFYRGVIHIELGHIAAAEADLRESAALAAAHGSVFQQRLALYNLAAAYTNSSQPAKALAVAEEAWPLMADAPQEDLALVFRSMFVECQFQLGQWGPMWEHLSAAAHELRLRAQPMLLLGLANCALEPAAVLGQWPTVQPLLRALDEAGTLDNVPVAAEILLGAAHAELIRGEPTAAVAWLRRVTPAGEAEHPRVRCRAALLRAELALDAGAELALAALHGPHGLPAADDPGMTPELRLRTLVLRHRTGLASRDEALAALTDPAAHAGVRLLLARELRGEVYTAERAQAAASLAAQPAVQASFLATWR